jgi:DNA-binding NarL/FixJ family response regulator
MKRIATQTLCNIEGAFAQISGSPLHYDYVLSSNLGLQQALKLLSDRAKLTEAELSVLECFACGAGLRQIAASRQRSYTTIRNQFQAILEKTGCQSQTDLLRILLGLSYLLMANSLNSA